MTFSRREQLLALVAGTAILYGLTVAAVGSKMNRLRRVRERQEQLRDSIERSKSIVAKEAIWDERFQACKHLLPSYPHGEKLGVRWLSIMDSVARRHKLTILRSEAGKERKYGEIYEIPIECKDWEGTLEAIIDFLIDLQSESAILDVRKFFIRPKNKRRGALVLRGNLTLYCVYTRGTETNGDE